MTELNQSLDDQLREIKRRLRAAMNGVLSGTMRKNGVDYRVNFGVDQPRLAEIATEIPHTYELAAALWKEDIRELRLLAIMTMPQSDFDEELAMLWMEQLRYAEEAQVLVLPSASLPQYGVPHIQSQVVRHAILIDLTHLRAVVGMKAIEMVVGGRGTSRFPEGQIFSGVGSHRDGHVMPR